MDRQERLDVVLGVAEERPPRAIRVAPHAWREMGLVVDAADAAAIPAMVANASDEAASRAH